MELTLPNFDKLIEVNSLAEITDPLILDKDMRPSKNGLYSNEIFGASGSPQRRNTFAYISLGRKFISPPVYIALGELDRNIIKLVSGLTYAYIDKEGNIVPITSEDDLPTKTTKYGTGIDFIIDNYSKIKFKDNGIKGRKENIEFLSYLKPQNIFIDKFIVIPPFYRDIDLSSKTGTISLDDITSLYSSILSLTSSKLEGEVNLFVGNQTESKVQNKLVELHNLFTGKLAKKNGIIHRDLLGKGIDYASRSVISGPKVESNHYSDQQVPYGYTGVPLFMAIATFLPMVMHELTNFFQSFKTAVSITMNNGTESIDIDATTLNDISTDKLLKLIKLCASSPADRFNPIMIHDAKTGKKKKLVMFKEDLGRDFTLADMFFIVAERVLENEYIMATRYPLEDYRNIFISKIKLLTTEESTVQSIGVKEYSEYPLLKKDNRWIDSVRPNNAVLEAWGGDFDGVRRP